ncbi:MAG: type I methionyl aminopeptidase, partial [bacterium]|nr:type I methionyl aminopeptidase [bacterium]
MIFYKTWRELEVMHRANRLVLRALAAVEAAGQVGATTAELDEIAEDLILSAGGRPAFKGYRGFPTTLCTSVNEVIVHGIPSNRQRLADGDVVSIDCGTIVDGYHGDAAITFTVGKASSEARRLVATTRECLDEAISAVKPGARLGDLGAAVEGCAKRAGLRVVRKFAGHGIGRRLHEDPVVPSYGRAG